MYVDESDNAYRNIIVALDGSDLAERVLPHVESLAERFGSTVTLLRVVTPVEALLFAGTILEPISSRRHAELAETIEQLRSDAVSYLASLRDQLTAHGLAVECASPEGPASEVIVEQARQRAVDLIAMTTHGRGGLTHWVFGSVAEDVLRHAPCPVLLVRIDQEGRTHAEKGGRRRPFLEVKWAAHIRGML
jgi:nucleotide-binding universal stress UspA family protein